MKYFDKHEPWIKKLTFFFSDLSIFERKIIIKKQLFESDCGATCLESVLKYLNINFDPYALRNLLPTSKMGVSMAFLADAASAMELKTTTVNSSLLLVLQKNLPVIALTSNHFVVLVKRKNGKIVLADPATGKSETRSFHEVATMLSGYFLTIEPSSYKGKSNTTHQSIQVFPNISKILRMNLKNLIHTVAITVCVSVLGFFIYSYYGIALDQLSSGTWGSNLLLLSVTLTLFILMYSAVSFFSSFAMAKTRFFLNYFGIRFINTSILSLPYSIFLARTKGDFISAFSDISEILLFCYHETSLFIHAISTAILVFSIFMIIDHEIAAVVFLYTTCSFVLDYITKTLNNKNIDNIRSIQTSELTTIIEGHNQAKSHIDLNGTMPSFLRWRYYLENKIYCEKKSFFIQITSDQVAAVFMQATVIVYATKAQAINYSSNNLALGVVVLALMPLFQQSISGIGHWIASSGRATVLLKKLNHFFLNTSKESGIQIFEKMSLVAIEIKNIEYKYPGRALSFAVKNFSSSFYPGDRAILSGPNGSGKSTLGLLLGGLLSPSNGSIKFSYKKNELLYLGSEPEIFSCSILENISFDLKSKEESVEHVLSIVGIDLKKLNRSIYEVLDPKKPTFSRGQLQRICLARALFRNPKVLVLDEATSYIDSSEEERIVSNICLLRSIDLVFLVSHKPYLEKLFSRKFIFERNNIITETL